MTDKIRNEFAVYGLEILMRSVLLVLYEENLGGESQLAHKITKRLGIPPLPSNSGGALLVTDVLSRLHKDKLVTYTTAGDLEITTKGIKFIEG